MALLSKTWRSPRLRGIGRFVHCEMQGTGISFADPNAPTFSLMFYRKDTAGDSESFRVELTRQEMKEVLDSVKDYSKMYFAS